MNVLFIISSDGRGSGGHYNSLNQISIEVGKIHDIKILLLGKGKSPIIESNPFFEEKIITGHGLNDFLSLNRKLKQICSKFPPTVIHCFDTESLNRVLFSNFSKNTPVVLNKCGGQNPHKSNYQHADAIVVFSQENQRWFIDNKNYNEEDIFLIPNRVRKLDILPESQRNEKASKDKITFVRVSRLGGAYEMTLQQTYILLDKLSEKHSVELFVVGRIQDKERFEKLEEIGLKKSYDVTFITDDRAFRGSDFLYLADFVVGTGRSLMEATSLGIPTLTPAKNSKIPILVNKNNVNNFLSTNFSERNVAFHGDEEDTLGKIDRISKNKQYKEKAEDDARVIFKEYFGSSKIVEKYNKVYDYVISRKNSRWELIKKNIPYLIKYLVKGN